MNFDHVAGPVELVAHLTRYKGSLLRIWRYKRNQEMLDKILNWMVEKTSMTLEEAEEIRNHYCGRRRIRPLDEKEHA